VTRPTGDAGRHCCSQGASIIASGRPETCKWSEMDQHAVSRKVTGTLPRCWWTWQMRRSCLSLDRRLRVGSWSLVPGLRSMGEMLEVWVAGTWQTLAPPPKVDSSIVSGDTKPVSSSPTSNTGTPYHELIVLAAANQLWPSSSTNSTHSRPFLGATLRPVHHRSTAIDPWTRHHQCCIS
jgi:hypothetical protein